MMIFSFNYRGLVSSSKKLALRDLVKSYVRDVLILQEMQGFGKEIKGSLSKLLPGWSFQTLNAKQRLGGLEMGSKDGILKVVNYL